MSERGGGEVVTRFAPSPTGFLHIGGARTALFNWLFARRHGGRFLLRIEDTDRARSTEAATAAIFEGLRWLGLDWDGEAVSQASRAERHRAAAEEMLARGGAYRCYATKEEIEAAKAAAAEAGGGAAFQSPWRDADPASAPDGAPFVVRLRAPRSGETVVEDAVQGVVRWRNDTLDDLVLLRSDGTPTYMLAVVVDDHDMGVTHVVRGDDHLTNAARQSLIYEAMGWPRPTFAHIPLIHGADGAKLSKRHGALGVEAYRDMGFPAVAMINYLARLGWSHGDDEVFSPEQAIAWFGLEAIGKAPARFDVKKLEHVSGRHLSMMAPDAALAALDAFLEGHARPPTPPGATAFRAALPALLERAKTLKDLLDMGRFAMAERPIELEEKAAAALDATARAALARLKPALEAAASWERAELEAALAAQAEAEGVKLGKIAQPLRAALTGQAASPGALDVMLALGREESLARLADAAAPEA